MYSQNHEAACTTQDARLSLRAERWCCSAAVVSLVACVINPAEPTTGCVSVYVFATSNGNETVDFSEVDQSRSAMPWIVSIWGLLSYETQFNICLPELPGDSLIPDSGSNCSQRHERATLKHHTPEHAQTKQPCTSATQGSCQQPSPPAGLLPLSPLSLPPA